MSFRKCEVAVDFRPDGLTTTTGFRVWSGRVAASLRNTKCVPRTCPRCGGEDIYAAYDVDGLRERAAALAFRFPVECGGCGQRFMLSLLAGHLVLVLHRPHVIALVAVLLFVCALAFIGGMALAGHWY